MNENQRRFIIWTPCYEIDQSHIKGERERGEQGEIEADGQTQGDDGDDDGEANSRFIRQAGPTEGPLLALGHIS